MALYVSSIAYELGDPASVEEIAELGTDSLLEMFQALGLAEYARSSRTPVSFALDAARRTIAASGVSPAEIGLVVYATNTLCAQEHSRNDLRRFCDELQLQHALVVGTFAWECSNLYPAIAVAADAISAGRVHHALVVSTDTCLPGESRILPPNLTVLSDGACSFILSSVPVGGSSFEISGMGMTADPSLALVDPSGDMQEFFNRTVRGVAGAARSAMDAGGFAFGDLAFVLTNNYNISIMRTFAIQVGYEAAKAYTKNLPRFAHAYAADCAINLADLDASGALSAGDQGLMILSGPTAWGAITLTKSERGEARA
jgi:3-oxoacyl-[acyl-carrier-protein] synthase III